MKKIEKTMKTVSRLFFAAIALSLIGCGSAPKSEETAKTTEPVKTSETKKQESAEKTDVKNTTEKEFVLKTPETAYIEPELPDSEPYFLDDFEEGNYWYGVGDTWDQWGSHNLSLTADLSKEWKSGGTYSLKCTMDAATADTSKQATWCGTPADPDISGFKWVAVDIYNPEDFEYELNIAVQNKIDWAWEESNTVLVPTGVHTALFDISNMKDEYMQSVFVFMIQSINEHDAGTIYFDNFRLYE